MPKKKPQSFNASCLQVRRAYENHFGILIGSMSYQEAGNILVKEMGLEAAQTFILSQSNDPNTVETLRG